MTTGLNIGHWSWDDRWTYPDQMNDKPFNLQANAGKPSKTSGQTRDLGSAGSGQNRVAFPMIPTRKCADPEMYESVYAEKFGTPLYATNQGTGEYPPANIKTRMRRSRGKRCAPETFLHHHGSSHYHETMQQRSTLKPEDHSFRLWGRFNPAHCVMPYTTESRRAYIEFDERDPLDRTNYTRVIRKDYKEAIARQYCNNKEAKLAGGG